MLIQQLKNYSSLIAYILLLFITSIATGESFARTLYDTSIGSRVIFYTISFVLLASLYSLGLTTLSENWAMGEKKKTYFGGILFIILWLFLSVWTNAHFFYIAQNMSDIQRDELSDVQIKLRTLGNDSAQELENLENTIEDSVSVLNGAMREQIRDPDNGGIGDKTRIHIASIQTFLGGNAITELKGNGNNNKLADLMYNQVNERLQDRLLTLQKPREKIIKLFDDDSGVPNLIGELEEAIDFYDDQPSNHIKSLLRRSYGKFNELSSQVQTIFETPLFGVRGVERFNALKENIGVLPNEVASINLEKIGGLFSYIKNHNKNKATLFWSLFLALAFDLISFFVYLRWLKTSSNKF
jgi:hypothetical protein